MFFLTKKRRRERQSRPVFSKKEGDKFEAACFPRGKKI